MPSNSNDDLAKPGSQFRFPAVPNGIPNEKKRRHGDISSDDSPTKANSESCILAIPNDASNEKRRRHADISSDDEPATKKIRGAVQWTPDLHEKAKEELKMRPSKVPRTRSSSNGGKKRGVLSLSRLNVLATPKKKVVEDVGAKTTGGSGRAKGFWKT